MLAHANKRVQRGIQPLAAAREVLRRDGVDAVTLRGIAREGGFTNPALYRHYSSKQALLEALIREVYGDFLQVIIRAGAGSNPRESLIRGLQAFREFAIEDPNGFELLFLRPRTHQLDVWPHDHRSKNPSRGFTLLVNGVSAAMDPDSKGPDPVYAALSCHAHALGLVSLYRGGRFGTDVEAFREFFDHAMLIHLGALIGSDPIFESKRSQP